MSNQTTVSIAKIEIANPGPWTTDKYDTTTKHDRAAAAAFFNDQPEWDLTIAHWVETGEKRYGMGTVRPNVLALAAAFAAHAAIKKERGEP